MAPIDVVQRYFKTMQTGPSDADALFALFREDAVYVEPFSAGGKPSTHEGIDAIRSNMRASWEHTPPELTLEVNRIHVDGEVVRSEWTCSCPTFQAPIKGVDVCTVRAGRIARLEVSFA